MTPAQQLVAHAQSGVRRWATNLPIWSWILGIYGVSRLWGWIVFSLVGKQQQASPWSDGPMGYLQYIGIWDSDWYRHIAESGYPTTLPMGAGGTVDQNPWAFYPLFPYAASGLMKATGWSWAMAGGTVSLVCGAVTAILLYGIFTSSRTLALGSEKAGGEQFVSPRRILHGLGLRQPARGVDHFALWCTALVLFNPVAPILQTPYAESLNLMFLAGCALALVRGNLLLCAILLVPTCLSRPVGVPLAASLGLWWLTRFILAYRADTETSGSPRIFRALRETAPFLGVGLLACVFAFAWPAIAWAVTGRVDAYTATETAWRGEHLLPVQPWIQQSLTYFGDPGPVILLALVVGFVALMHSRVVLTTIPLRLRFWCYAYVAYLLVFLFPQSSTFRLLLPMFPLAAPLMAVSDSKAYRTVILLGAAIGQLIWVGWLWHWKELPSGGDYPP
ncbi:hypothetical protein [Kocuria sp. HSID16901]|uniref:hypothetical protein n=1 Tax=Kocuria sp. HSID16901 TaxID=2419505 RepID=UPI00066030D0|nr:hypothetical protein [Kocuria sp. HSID16901]